MGGLGTISSPRHSVLVGISAMLTIYYAGFSFGWAPAYHIITSEIPTSRTYRSQPDLNKPANAAIGMRDVTYTVASTVNVITQFVVSFTIPYLWYEPYAALGPKTGLIFGSFCAGTVVFIFFCIPECRKLSLEEIDHLFIEKVLIRKFGRQIHGEILPPPITELTAGKQEDGLMIEQREFIA
jgi:SP family sugar:H+ symporter-like MFS transporter